MVGFVVAVEPALVVAVDAAVVAVVPPATVVVDAPGMVVVVTTVPPEAPLLMPSWAGSSSMTAMSTITVSTASPKTTTPRQLRAIPSKLTQPREDRPGVVGPVVTEGRAL